jgi:hypothetical protein
MVFISSFCKVDKPLHAANNFDEFTSALSTYLIDLCMKVGLLVV